MLNAKIAIANAGRHETLIVQGQLCSEAAQELTAEGTDKAADFFHVDRVCQCTCPNFHFLTEQVIRLELCREINLSEGLIFFDASERHKI